MAKQDIKAGRAFVELYLKNQLARGLRTASRQLKAFSDGADRIGRRLLAFGGAGVAGFGLTIKAASDLEETMNKFNVVFV